MGAPLQLEMEPFDSAVGGEVQPLINTAGTLPHDCVTFGQA